MSQGDQAGGAVVRAMPETHGDEAERTADERLAARVARADRYFDEHLQNQRDWYSKKASAHKGWSQRFSFTVILVGALITFLQVLQSPAAAPWLIPTVTAALGAVVAVLTGVQRIWKYDESWPAYRKASEQMKREYRLYINGAGAYAEVADEDEAYRRFVENTEAIIAEEQQIYWQSRAARREDGADKSKPPEVGG